MDRNRRLIIRLVVKERTLCGGGFDLPPKCPWLDMDRNRRLIVKPIVKERTLCGGGFDLPPKCPWLDMDRNRRLIVKLVVKKQHVPNLVAVVLGMAGGGGCRLPSDTSFFFATCIFKTRVSEQH